MRYVDSISTADCICTHSHAYRHTRIHKLHLDWHGVVHEDQVKAIRVGRDRVHGLLTIVYQHSGNVSRLQGHRQHLAIRGRVYNTRISNPKAKRTKRNVRKSARSAKCKRCTVICAEIDIKHYHRRPERSELQSRLGSEP